MGEAQEANHRKFAAISPALRVSIHMSPTGLLEEKAHGANKPTTFNLEPCTLTENWERALGPHEGSGYGSTVARYAQIQQLKYLVEAPQKRLIGSAQRAARRAHNAEAHIRSYTPDDEDQRLVVNNAAALDSHDQGVPPTCIQMDKACELRAAVDSGTIVTITNIHPSQLERFDVSGRKCTKCFDGNVTASLGEGVKVGSTIKSDNIPNQIIIRKAYYVPASLTTAATGHAEVEYVPESNDLVPSQSPLASNPCADAPEEPYVEKPVELYNEDVLSNGYLEDEISTEDSCLRRNLSGQELASDQRSIRMLVRDQNLKVDIDEEDRLLCTSFAHCKIMLAQEAKVELQFNLRTFLVRKVLMSV